jgi:SAM-dependent MidA family methyltransferase
MSSMGERLERFDAYVERCLYHPRTGFYTSGVGSAGRRRGDFVTSPEVGPLFAEVLARFCDRVWVDRGRPERFPVVDAGTGPGALARQLAAAEGPSASARVVTGFDRSTAVAGSTGSGSGGSDPSELAGAVVIANEVLDNIPFRIVEHHRGRWHEVHVVTPRPDGDADAVVRVAEELVPVEEVDGHLGAVLEGLARAGVEPADGLRVPILDGAARWLGELLATGPALVIAFDYGAPTTAELVTRGGWLRTYRRHEVGEDPLDGPGTRDITVDVAVDQLPPPDLVIDQAAFLRRWGIDELVDEGRRYWAAHAARPDVRAVRMRSRVSEAEALLDPRGLGGWLVCGWGPVPS